MCHVASTFKFVMVSSWSFFHGDLGQKTLLPKIEEMTINMTEKIEACWNALGLVMNGCDVG